MAVSAEYCFFGDLTVGLRSSFATLVSPKRKICLSAARIFLIYEKVEFWMRDLKDNFVIVVHRKVFARSGKILRQLLQGYANLSALQSFASVWAIEVADRAFFADSVDISLENWKI